MKTIKHYLSVYYKFIETSFTEASSFRLSFFLIIIMDLFFYFSTLATVSIIFDHVSTIGPWDRDRLLFFISFMLAIDHLHMTVVSEGFWMLSQHIRTGSMDYILLKPVHSIFTVFFRHFRPATILNGFVAWGFLIYYGINLNLPFLSWILLPILVLSGFMLLIVLEFIITSSMFWMVEGLGINFLRMQLQQLSRWPDFIYASLSRKVLTIGIPLLLIGSAPVRFLFDYSQYQYLIGLFIAIIFFWFVLLKIWALALRKYDSASS